MVNDLISDSLARIKNALDRNRSEVTLLNSKLVKNICDILVSENYASKVEVTKGEGDYKVINLHLNLENKDKSKRIQNLKRVSRPGRRIYKGYRDLKPIRSGYGVSVLSTPKGVMTDKDARKKTVGGEIICTVF
jgi:small subunit ribosomal protein S8